MKSKYENDLQSWYTSRMQAAGYKVENRGCCFGIANMSMQAFLVNEMAQFNARLERIKQTPQERFSNDFAFLRQEADELRKLGQIDAAQEIIDHIVDFKAFFDGIILYQNPSEYPELIPNLNKVQDTASSLPLTKSIKLEQSNSPIDIDNLTCLFTRESLTNFFEHLQENLGDYSFALILSGIRHVININYDATTKRWIWIDANHLPPQEFADSESLTSALSDFFKERLCVQMNLDIYTNQKNGVEMQNAYQVLKTQEQYQLSYGRSLLNKLLDSNRLHSQTGYEITEYLLMLVHKKILAIDEWHTISEKIFAKVSSSDILEYICTINIPYSYLRVGSLIDVFQAKPSPYAMREASMGGLFEGILEDVNKLELFTQEDIFTAATDRENNILMAVMFTSEKVSLVLRHLEKFSMASWERILTQKNDNGENAIILSALYQPQFVPKLLEVIDKFSWQTQKEIIEPVMKVLKDRVTSKIGGHQDTLELLSTHLLNMRNKVPWKERIMGEIPENIRNFLGLKMQHQKLVQSIDKKTDKPPPKPM